MTSFRALSACPVEYTLGDILSFRTDPKPVRAVAAISTVAVSTFYLTAQMVGAGKLMALLVKLHSLLE